MELKQRRKERNSDNETSPAGGRPGLRLLAGNVATGFKNRSSAPPRVHIAEILISWIGAFLGIGALAFLELKYVSKTDMTLMIGSFGASAVLVYGAIKSPFAQPRNLVGGHVVSALVGVASFQLFSGQMWFACAFAVATAIAAMHLTRTVHPPGGATALIAVMGSPKIHALGYMYAAVPVGAGALALLAVSLIVNNLPSGRSYPEYWL